MLGTKHLAVLALVYFVVAILGLRAWLGVRGRPRSLRALAESLGLSYRRKDSEPLVIPSLGKDHKRKAY